MASLRYELDLHLAYLLFQEDSLAVPGLGTFSVRRYGAEIQLPAGLILPPARRVTFSPEVGGDNAVLVAHLVHIEGLSPEEASAGVADEVRGWQRVLERGDRLNLRGIGSLRRADSAWVFKASLETNFLADSFGLPMFRMDLLASADPYAPVYLDRPAPRTRSWQAAAVVAGALGLAAIGGSKDDFRVFVQSASVRTELHAWWQGSRGQLEFAGRQSAEWLSSAVREVEQLFSGSDATEPIESPAAPAVAAPAGEEPLAAASKSPEKLREVSVAQPRADEPAPEDGAVSGYALVVGAFEDDSNAQRVAQRLRKAGYPARVLQSRVGLKKGALRTFADADSARNAKTELKSDFPAIWIYHE